MSERGSFVTEYVYCEHCFAGLKRVLLAAPCKHFNATVLPHLAGGEDRIIAGRVGGLHAGEEREDFEFGSIRDDIQGAICHPVVIAVLPEDSQRAAILRFTPGRRVEVVAGLGECSFCFEPAVVEHTETYCGRHARMMNVEIPKGDTGIPKDGGDAPS